jgi:hypothetical protein
VSGEALALGITFLIHVIGLCVLFGALLSPEDRAGWRSWWPGDDGPSDDGPDGGPGSPPPLPDAKPARARLREPGKLADAHTRPARRPEHAPERVPERAERY